MIVRSLCLLGEENVVLTALTDFIHIYAIASLLEECLFHM